MLYEAVRFVVLNCSGCAWEKLVFLQEVGLRNTAMEAHHTGGITLQSLCNELRSASFKATLSGERRIRGNFRELSAE